MTAIFTESEYEIELSAVQGPAGASQSVNYVAQTLTAEQKTQARDNIDALAKSIGSTANLPLITTASGAITVGAFGTTANTFCQGNDSRLSDARTPTAHTQAASTITGNFPGLTSVVAGGSVLLWGNNGYGLVSLGDVLGNSFEIINVGNWKIAVSNNLPIEVHINGNKQLQFNDGSSVFTGEVVWEPEASTSLSVNGQFTVEKVSNTEIRLKLRGSDGVSRSVVLTLS